MRERKDFLCQRVVEKDVELVAPDAAARPNETREDRLCVIGIFRDEVLQQRWRRLRGSRGRGCRVMLADGQTALFTAVDVSFDVAAHSELVERGVHVLEEEERPL